MDKEYKKSSIKMIGLGKEASEILQQLDFLDSHESLLIYSEKEMETERILRFCKSTNLVCVAVDLNNIFTVKHLLEMVSFLGNDDTKVLTVIKNGNSQPKLIKNIKKHTSILDIDKQEDSGMLPILHQLYCLFLNNDEPIRAVWDEISVQRNIEMFFDMHQEIYIYSDTNISAFLDRLKSDNIIRNKLTNSASCWVGFIGSKSKFNEVIAIVEFLETDLLNDDAMLYMQQEEISTPNEVTLLVGFCT